MTDKKYRHGRDRDLEASVAQSNEQLNATLLGSELVEWLKS